MAIYLGRELINAPKAENISTVAHIAGGLCGSMFGFMVAPKAKRSSKKEKEEKTNSEEKKTQRTSFFQRQTEQPREEDSTVLGTLEI